MALSQTKKGIILAGGSGTRLHPVTMGVNKHLLPVYDKPLIYYPLSVLMMTGIQDILLITTPLDVEPFQRLLGDGHRWGISIRYVVQTAPRGLADAMIAGREFIGNDKVALILGDNLFFGDSFKQAAKNASAHQTGAFLFGYPVNDPHHYGVVELDSHHRPLAIEEKPSHPKSNYAVPGFYFYDHQIVDIASSLEPSPRGDLEITDAHRVYLERGELHVHVLEKDVTWLDAGTPETLLEATQYVRTTQNSRGAKIACLEEIALNCDFITRDRFAQLAQESSNDYGDYLLHVLESLETT